MMNDRILVFTTAAILLMAALFSGCCGLTSPPAQPSPSPSASLTPTPTATPLPSVTPIPDDKPYDIGDRLSMVYAVTQYDGIVKVNDLTDLIDYQKITLPNGNPGYAIQYLSSKKGSTISTMITAFYDSDGMPVNGSRKTMDSGREVDKTIMAYDDVESFDLLNFVARKADKASGYEDIGVIAGVHNCGKFVSEDGSKIIWLAEKVPVPLKIETVNGNSKYVYELVSWSKL
jgi:hypothetical protein